MELFIFDFDDTLAITDSRVRVVRDGQDIWMTSREFADFPVMPSDTIDFGDFSRVSGTLIKDTVDLMQQAIIDGADVHIVTARGIAEPVKKFLEDHLGSAPPISATAGSAGKVPWLEQKLMSGNYDKVVVYEDCEKNIRALKTTVENFNATNDANVQYSAMCILPDQSMVQKETHWIQEDLLIEGNFRDTIKNFLRKTW